MAKDKETYADRIKEVGNKLKNTETGRKSMFAIPGNKEYNVDVDWYEKNIVPGFITWINTIDPVLFYMFCAFVHHKTKEAATIKHPKFVSSMCMYEWLSSDITIDENTSIDVLRDLICADRDARFKFLPQFIDDLVHQHIDGNYTSSQSGEYLIYGIADIGSTFDDAICKLKQLYMHLWGTQIPGIGEALSSGIPKIVFVPMRPLAFPSSLSRSATVIDFDSYSANSELVKDLRKIFAVKKYAYDKMRDLHFTPTLVESAVAYDDNLNGEDTTNLLRTSLVQSTPGITSITSPPPMEEVGGFDYLKKWALRAKSYMESDKFEINNRPRGILIVGPPGTGKTMAARALSAYMEWPGIELSISQIMAGLLGKTEENLRAALNTIRSIGSCIGLIDEVEKNLGGSTSSNRTDGGALQRVVSSILQFMEEDNHKTLLVMTANDIADIPPPLMRSGRIDKILFADTPSRETRKIILNTYIDKSNLKMNLTDVGKIATLADGFSGAELKESVKEVVMAVDAGDYAPKNSADLCKLISKVIDSITPISKSRADDFEEMRKWASINAIPVDKKSII